MRTYTKNDHITTVAHVEEFFHHLLYDRELNFHPDDDFAEYVDRESKPSFNAEEVALYNRLMEESFDACDREGRDIYLIGWEDLVARINGYCPINQEPTE